MPGSLGVAPSHLAHAETLVGLGLAAFVLDQFGPRNVTSTVSTLKAGYGVRGATLGSQGDQAALFRDEMSAFFRRTLGG